MGGSSPHPPRAAPKPDSPSLSAHYRSAPPLSIQLPPHTSSFDKNCAHYRAPYVDQGRYEDMSYDQIHQLCKRRGRCRKDSKEVSESRLDAVGAEARRRAFRGDTSMDTSVAATGKRNRGPEGVAENPDELQSYQDKRCRVGDLHLASDVGKEVAKEHARRRYPESKSRSDVTQASAAEGVGAAISARVAEECNRVLAQDLTGEGEELNRELVDATHCVAAI